MEPHRIYVKIYVYVVQKNVGSVNLTAIIINILKTYWGI